MAWCCEATCHYLNQCLAKFVCHYLGANELKYSQTAAELTDFYLVVCMASNLIFRKQRHSGRRRSYIYPTWQCRIDISHYNYVMSAVASQITSVSIVCSTVGSVADQRKDQSFASLAFVRGIRRWPVNSRHKRPVTRKMFPFDDVIMINVVPVSLLPGL